MRSRGQPPQESAQWFFVQLVVFVGRKLDLCAWTACQTSITKFKEISFDHARRNFMRYLLAAQDRFSGRFHLSLGIVAGMCGKKNLLAGFMAMDNNTAAVIPPQS